MIDIQNVSFTYRKGAEAIADASANLGEGIWLLLGENGAGKSTLLHLIAGLLTPKDGTITVNGENTALRRPSTLANMFIVTDEMKFPARTINEFRFVHSRFYPCFSDDTLKANLTMFDMDGNEPLANMSFGTRKKAQLAYACSLGVNTLLLDEPANGLDIQSRKSLRRMLAINTSPEQTVIVSTHSVADLGPLYSGVVILNRGRMIASCTTEQILSHLSFNVGTTPSRDALYSEQDLGRFRTVVVNPTGEPATDIDFALFYGAMMTPARNTILSLLNNNAK